MSKSANSSRKIHAVGGLQGTLLSGLGSGIRIWMETLHYKNLAPLSRYLNKTTSGTVLLLWHNRLFPLIGALNQLGPFDRKLYGLVSASRDGGQLSHFMERLGVRPVRGSSSRRGAESARELVKVLKAGHNVAITVDGPRGPCYAAQEGAAFLVHLTGAPVLLIGAECESCHEVDSWDRFIIPTPFSRVTLKVDHFKLDSLAGAKRRREGIQELIQKKLSGLTGDVHRQA